MPLQVYSQPYEHGFYCLDMLLNNCNYVIESMSVFILWFVYYNVNTLTDAVHSLVAVATAALVRVDEVGARLGGWTRTRHALVNVCNSNIIVESTAVLLFVSIHWGYMPR